MHQFVTLSSNTCNQLHVQIKHSVPHLQDSNLTLAGIKGEQILENGKDHDRNKAWKKSVPKP